MSKWETKTDIEVFHKMRHMTKEQMHLSMERIIQDSLRNAQENTLLVRLTGQNTKLLDSLLQVKFISNQE